MQLVMCCGHDDQVEMKWTGLFSWKDFRTVHLFMLQPCAEIKTSSAKARVRQNISFKGHIWSSA